MTAIAIIIGSTRPGRAGQTVAEWVHQHAVAHEGTNGGATFEIVDLASFDFPHLDEAVPAAAGQYDRPHTQRWAEKIASFDGFIFVTPEYNHSYPGVLKTAIDFIYAEWSNKAAGFVGYGVNGGVRAVEHLRGVMGNLRVADVTSQVTLSLYDDFVDLTTFQPGNHHDVSIKSLLDDVIDWSAALKTVRAA